MPGVLVQVAGSGPICCHGYTQVVLSSLCSNVCVSSTSSDVTSMHDVTHVYDVVLIYRTGSEQLVTVGLVRNEDQMLPVVIHK